jgi:hypothetical protein|tara:strand:+ start:239 stop:772 length:534 start_codon:yes stop_codon:yes gene_type:complete
MRLLGIFFLVMGLSATAALAEGPEPASAEQKQKSPEQQAMDQLAEAGLRQALQAIQRSGGLYPFGLLQSGDTVRAVGYSGDKADAPSAEEWSQDLFWQLRKIGKEQPDIELMALFRLHDITAENGEKVTGVWAQVDHRGVRPWVIFLPLLKNEKGKHELGDMVYYATEQPLFDKSGE